MILKTGTAAKSTHAANSAKFAAVSEPRLGSLTSREHSCCLRENTRWNLISSKSIPGLFGCVECIMCAMLGRILEMSSLSTPDYEYELK